MVRDSLCELSIRERGMEFKAILAYEPKKSPSRGESSPRIDCLALSSAPILRTSCVFLLLPALALAASSPEPLRDCGVQCGPAALYQDIAGCRDGRCASSCHPGSWRFWPAAGSHLFYPATSWLLRRKAPGSPLYQTRRHHYSKPVPCGYCGLSPGLVAAAMPLLRAIVSARSRVTLRTDAGVFTPLLK
ncbi:Hok/gef family [Kluyvera cryocrescens]|uniref:Hok/gef family n=1 Tax=Kluyvera cryocrescens TaxID=580 RepID=A0A485ATY9_KLUCR|nr:Hok/gef family [Kluyvera cryocrescens]